MMRAAARKQELPALVLAQTRQFVAPLRVDFSEDVSAAKPSKEPTALLDEWKGKKASTEKLLKLMQSYKDLGDSKAEPMIKFHNPRTFEDLSAPVPNFRAMNLKAGEVGKFFDSVLTKRAGEAVDTKAKWWAQRKAEAEAAVASKEFAPVGTLAVPLWQLGKPVTLEALNKVTDKYLASLEPSRKVDDFQFVSKAVAAKVLAERRAEVHERYVKMWAKKLLVSPELAAVPLKDIDSQLASKFELVAPQYAELLQAASAGSKTLAERMSHHPAFSSFLLKREAANVKEDFPPSEIEAKGAALAAELEDPAAALSKLLGPELSAGGSALLSEQVAAVTAHKFSPERYMYREGLKLAARYKEEEAALKAELKPVYGDNVDVSHFQSQPRTPKQQVADKMKEVELNAAAFKAERDSAATPFLQYAIAKKQQVLSDPANIVFEEVLYPGLVEELLDVELAELKEQESMVDDAEEEELWMLTLAAQFRHIQKHFGVDLPHSVLAHMDPILFKKIDWETTNGLEDWDITLEDMAADYAKEQWGVENLSHHFLPLIRYRRMKARKQGGKFEPELVAARS